MYLAFTLGMPSNNSWNGRWSGENDVYAKVVTLSTKKAKEILDIGHFRYDFGDGWAARISVKEIDIKEGRKLKRKSKGFCGYDWMVDSIIDKLNIVG